MMLNRSKYRRLSSFVGLLSVLMIGVSSCSDEQETPTSPSVPSVPESPSAAVQSSLRVAVLTDEARAVDVAVNGEIVFRGLTYPQVSEYTSLGVGDYRIQFLPSGRTSPSLAETFLTLGETSLTVTLTGISTLEIHTIEDTGGASPDRARVRLLNAVADFPAPVDLAVVNGPMLAENVEYLIASGYTEVIGGIYDLEMRRAGTKESTAIAHGWSFVPGANYTVFGVGSLREEDLQMLVAVDSR